MNVTLKPQEKFCKKFISNGQNVITDVSNYVLNTSNTLATHLNDLNSKIFDNSNLIKTSNLPVAKYDANGSVLGIIRGMFNSTVG